MTVAIQVGILFVLIFAGLLMGKYKVVNKVGIDQFTDFLLYIITPCLIVNAFLKVEYNDSTVTQLLISAACAVLCHLVGIIIAFAFKKIQPISKQAVYRFGIIFSNGGFMALPLVQALIGEKGVFLVSPYVIAINVFTWTYGVALFKSDKKTSKLKAFLNPGVLGILIGLPLFLLRIPVHEIIAKPVAYLAEINTPIAMIITGYCLLHSNIKQGLRDKMMWITSVIRLIVIPLIMLVVFKYVMQLQGDLLIACMVPACAPCAVNNMMISAKFGGDTETASRLIPFTTLISIITIPLMLVLTKL